MEGPSLLLAAEQLQPFIGQRVLEVRGNATIDMERCEGQVVRAVFNHGKQLFLQFGNFALRTHFLLFGTYDADLDGVQVSGDYPRAHEPRLALRFRNGELRLFACSVRYVEGKNVRSGLDLSTDVLSSRWDPAQALAALKGRGREQIGDVLLDQDAFAGVGNIIRNEVLWLARVRPDALVGNISVARRSGIIALTRSFSKQFLRWRRAMELKKHLHIYKSRTCPRCGGPVLHEKLGALGRTAHFCPHCQKKTAR
ncbi:MAG: zinc finger domain-containing protein [Flavobacteriales bacterium]